MRALTSEILFKRKEAAKYLEVSESTLANWAVTKKFRLPYFRVGRGVRYKKTDLDDFVNSNRCEPITGATK